MLKNLIQKQSGTSTKINYPIGKKGVVYVSPIGKEVYKLLTLIILFGCLIYGTYKMVKTKDTNLETAYTILDIITIFSFIYIANN